MQKQYDNNNNNNNDNNNNKNNNDNNNNNNNIKDTIKDVLKRGEVLDSWTECVDNRHEWRKLTHEVCNGIYEKRRVNTNG